jgi:hypothetical protein
MAVSTDQAPKGEAVEPAKPAGMSSDRWGGRLATLLVVSCPLGQAVAAELSPRYDPLFIEVFGAATPQDTARAAGGVREASTTGAGTWALRANAMQRYTDGLAIEPSAVAAEDWHFQPRYVYSTPAGGSVALSRDALTRVWSGDLTAGRTLLQDEHGQLQVVAGLKLGGYEEGARAAPLSAGGFESSLANTALLPAMGSGTLVGPTLGIAGDRQMDRHRLSGVFQQSMLYGQAELSRSVTPSAGTEELRSGVESYIERRDVNVSVSELGVKYLYELADGVAFGMGAMASVWWDAPGSQPDGKGRVIPGDDTLIYLGGMGTLEMQF